MNVEPSSAHAGHGQGQAGAAMGGLPAGVTPAMVQQMRAAVASYLQMDEQIRGRVQQAALPSG
ncbi:MAG TPA: hypothetical protein VF006_27675 [Longimicrobium sp.]